MNQARIIALGERLRLTPSPAFDPQPTQQVRPLTWTETQHAGGAAPDNGLRPASAQVRPFCGLSPQPLTRLVLEADEGA